MKYNDRQTKRKKGKRKEGKRKRGETKQSVVFIFQNPKITVCFIILDMMELHLLFRQHWRNQGAVTRKT